MLCGACLAEVRAKGSLSQLKNPGNSCLIALVAEVVL